jgi:pimeloyl-ACP methyl ester carboxylesterase
MIPELDARLHPEAERRRGDVLQRLFASAMVGRLFARPWLDPVCIWGMEWLLPASRAWAAAGIANGAPEKFAAELGLARPPLGISRRLNRTMKLRAAAEEAFQIWMQAGFASGGDLQAAEARRRAKSQEYFIHRFAYALLARRHGIAAARLTIPAPEEVLAEFQPFFADPDQLFRLPAELPAVTRSASVDRGDVIEYWIKFASPSARDTAWAHVYEAKDRRDGQMPTLIFGHGFAMETEMLRSDGRGYSGLASRGLRIVLPDAPGHNRRAVPGRYGGESFIAAPPVSGLNNLKQAAQELGIIIDWCRAQGPGRVCLGGISLGALTAQVAACRMGTWPNSAKPDALMLLTTTDRVSSLTVDSAIAAAAGLDKAAGIKGWRPEDFAPLARIADATGAAPLDPANIVLLLGTRDNVTPIAGGRRLAEGWRIPPENLFIRDQGHFSAALGLGADPAPLNRAITILTR